MEPKDFDTILNKYIEDITEQGTSDGFTGAITQVHPHMNSTPRSNLVDVLRYYGCN